MANKPGTQARFVLFDVLYEDGSRRSNRKVPAELLGGLDGDLPARKEIEAQDNEIAKASGKAALRYRFHGTRRRQEALDQAKWNHLAARKLRPSKDL